jgi:hypothetical protein
VLSIISRLVAKYNAEINSSKPCIRLKKQTTTTIGNMAELENIISHAMAVLGDAVFFEIVMVAGLSKLSQTCKAYRYLQLRKDAVLAAIVGSSRASLHFESRLSLFGMMPRAIMQGSQAAINLIRVSRRYERNLIPNRRFLYPTFYAYAYYWGICGSSHQGRRRRMWKEIAHILCEMLEKDISIGITGLEPWSAASFNRRCANARHYRRYYAEALVPKV